MSEEYSVGAGFWKQKSPLGRPLLFSSPQLLWEAAEEYFTYCDNTPVLVKDWVGKDAMPVKREKPMPYSLNGFRLYVDASKNWWSEFRKAREAEKDEDFLGVISRIEDICYTQQYNGAVTGLYQQNIVARSLGLVEQSVVDAKVKAEVEAKNTIAIDYSKLSDGALREIAQLASESDSGEGGTV